MKKLSFIICAAVLPFSAFATLIVDETWADGERFTQDPANNSLAWYSSGGATSVITNVGSMERVASAHVVAYFTEPGDPVILGVGERIEMNFAVRFPFVHAGDTFGTGDFRAALFNSGGADNRVTGDSHGGTNANPTAGTFQPLFIPYTGYMGSGRLIEEEERLSLRKRLADQTGGGALIAAVAPFELMGDQTDSVDLSPDVVYLGTLVVDRVGPDAVEVSYTLSDGESTLFSIVRTDESEAFFTFDTVAFALGSNTASGFELQQVSIALISEGSGTTWAGFPLNANGWVDTGDFLGFVYPMGDFIYVLDLNTFLFLPESQVSSVGGWAYIFR